MADASGGGADLDALLAVQDADTALDQLHHRRATLPERAAVAALDTALADLEVRLTELADHAGQLDETTRRLEGEVAGLRSREKASETRLNSGTVSAARGLATLTEEIAGFRARATALEDELLEVMEAAEPVAEGRGQAEGERARLAGEREVATTALVAADAAVLALIEERIVARAEAAGHVAPELLSTYDGLRRRLGGVAVARLEGNRCTGCHLLLPALELDGIRRAPAGEAVRHEECGRILVRPPPPPAP